MNGDSLDKLRQLEDQFRARDEEARKADIEQMFEQSQYEEVLHQIGEARTPQDRARHPLS